MGMVLRSEWIGGRGLVWSGSRTGRAGVLRSGRMIRSMTKLRRGMGVFLGGGGGGGVCSEHYA